MKIQLNDLYLKHLQENLQLEINNTLDDLVLGVQKDIHIENKLKRKLKYLKMALNNTTHLLDIANDLEEITDEDYIGNK